MVKAKKKFKDFNCSDIWDYWIQQWHKEWNELYSGEHKGRQLSWLKNLLIYNDIYSILFNVDKQIKNRIPMSLFVENYDRYLVDSPNNKIRFYVYKFGKDEQKKMWQEIIDIENKWFPLASDKQKERELLKNLDDWCELVE